MLLIEKICIFVIMPKNLKNVFFTKHKNTTKLSYFSIHFFVVLYICLFIILGKFFHSVLIFLIINSYTPKLNMLLNYI